MFRERLIKAALMEPLFAQLLAQIDAAGFTARHGQSVDAALVPVPKQRNSRDDNALIKADAVPADWTAAKARQKDGEARLPPKE